MQFGFDDLAKYTFLPQAGEFVRSQGLSVNDLASNDYQNVVNRARERVLEAIRTARVSDKIEQKEVEIMSFPISLMLVRSSNLDHLMTRYALAEALRVESLLGREKNPRVVEDIFRDFIGVDLEHSTSPGLPAFRIPVAEYVRRAKEFHRSEWKLLNRTVGNGKVFVTQHDLIRLIREEIRLMILQRLKDVRQGKLPDNLQKIVQELVSLSPAPKTSFQTLNVSPENYPPCVRQALRMLERGENVPHYGRFLMTTYLLRVGKSVDDIVALFPKAPDFKKSITKYQVEHIAGLKGGRTRYSVPSCRTLQTHSFCFKDPVKCYEIVSPVQYPSKVARPVEKVKKHLGSTAGSRLSKRETTMRLSEVGGGERRDWKNRTRR